MKKFYKKLNRDEDKKRVTNLIEREKERLSRQEEETREEIMEKIESLEGDSIQENNTIIYKK